MHNDYLSRSIHRAGISRIEVLVIVSLLLLLTCLLVPAVRAAHASAHQTACANQIRQIGVGLQGFEKTNGRLLAKDNAEGKLGSWIVGILPHMGQQDLFDKVVEAFGGTLDRSPAWTFEDLRKAQDQLRPLTPTGFHCPADPAPADRATSYSGSAGTWGGHFHDDGIFRWANDQGDFAYEPLAVSAADVTDVTDGLSQTMAVSEWLHIWRTGKNGAAKESLRRSTWNIDVHFGHGADIDALTPIYAQAPRKFPMASYP